MRFFFFLAFAAVASAAKGSMEKSGEGMMSMELSDEDKAFLMKLAPVLMKMKQKMEVRIDNHALAI